MDEQELENMLKPFGHVISTRILRDANGLSRGVGFARCVWGFWTLSCSLSAFTPYKRQLSITMHHPKQHRPSPCFHLQQLMCRNIQLITSSEWISTVPVCRNYFLTLDPPTGWEKKTVWGGKKGASESRRRGIVLSRTGRVLWASCLYITAARQWWLGHAIQYC